MNITISQEIIKPEFSSLEEIGDVIEHSKLFSLDKDFFFFFSEENFDKIKELLKDQIIFSEKFSSKKYEVAIPLDKFFLPQHPKKLIIVSPTWFPDYLNKYESILEIR